MDKYNCKTCGSIIKNSDSNIRAHNKTIKHNNSLNKNSVEYKNNSTQRKQLRLNFKNSTKNLQNKIGVDNFKILGRLKKRYQRTGNDKESQAYKDYSDFKQQMKALKVEKFGDLPRQVVINESKISSSIVKSLTDLYRTTDSVSQVDIKNLLQKEEKSLRQLGTISDCQDLKDGLNDVYSDLSEITTKTYKSNVGAVYKAIHGTKWDCKSFDWLLDSKEVINFVENKMKVSRGKNAGKQVKLESKKSYYTAIVALLKVLPQKYQTVLPSYRKIMDEYANKSSIKKSLAQLTPEQKHNYVDWSTLQQKRKQNYHKLTTKSEKLIALFYTDLPPRRVNDFASMELLLSGQKIEKDRNYLIVDQKMNPLEVVFGNFKTAKNFVPNENSKRFVNDLQRIGQRFKLTDKRFEQAGLGDRKTFVKELKNLIVDRKINKMTSTWLFRKKNNNKKHTTAAAFSTEVGNVLQKMVGIKNKRPTSTILRHSYANFLKKRLPSFPLRLFTSAFMAHDVKTALSYANE